MQNIPRQFNWEPAMLRNLQISRKSTASVIVKLDLFPSPKSLPAFEATCNPNTSILTYDGIQTALRKI